METSGWVAVRCIFRTTWEGTQMYEERVTLWHATDTAVAIEYAEREAAAYATDTDAEYVGLAQAYLMVDEPGAGAEVFSLIRASTLEPDAYVDRFFDTGTERQGSQPRDRARGLHALRPAGRRGAVRDRARGFAQHVPWVGRTRGWPTITPPTVPPVGPPQFETDNAESPREE